MSGKFYIKYYPYGDCRNSQGNLATDRLFTGQRLDDTGLYYYGARYYDPAIGRFISPDSIVPDPFNPQAFNRYSYVLNNPLRYIDPTGHQMEIYDYYYEQMCESVGVGTDEGIAFVMEGDDVIGAIDIDTFVEWVDESPEPFDYISEGPGMIEKAMEAVGIESKKYYHMNLTADPIPVYYVGNEGVVPILLGSKSGISLYPIGTFVKESALARDPVLPAHEGYHYYEQSSWGIIPWVAAYYGEMFAEWAGLGGGDYWTGPYNINSREETARQWAGQSKHPFSPPRYPWWHKQYGDLILTPLG